MIPGELVQTEAHDRRLPPFAAILPFLDTSWLKKAVLLLTILVGSTSALSPLRVLAASLERLPGDRIVLTALGEKLAFREKDADHIELYWPQYPCKPKPNRVSLALWRDDPVVAACMNKAIPDNFPPGSQLSLTIRVRFTFENGEPYPEKGRRLDEPIGASSVLYPGQIRSAELPVSPRLLEFTFAGVLHVNKAFNPNIPLDGPPDSFGYRQYQRIGKESPSYRLPADRRLGDAVRSLDVACSDVRDSVCSISLRSSDGFVSTGVRWLGPSPRADWPLYDAAARKFANSIFVARPPGDVQ
jgi:hypothetical protein